MSSTRIQANATSRGTLKSAWARLKRASLRGFAEDYVGQRDVRIIDAHQPWHLEALQGDGSREQAMVQFRVHQG